MESNGNNEILSAINDFANTVETRFDTIEQRFGDVDKRFDKIETEIGEIKSEMGEIKSEMGEMKSEMGGIRTQMVTKDYLDDKLSDLRGDLVVLTRKEDTKLTALISVLAEKNVLTNEEAQHLSSMEPFPKLSS